MIKRTLQIGPGVQMKHCRFLLRKEQVLKFAQALLFAGSQKPEKHCPQNFSSKIVRPVSSKFYPVWKHSCPAKDQRVVRPYSTIILSTRDRTLSSTEALPCLSWHASQEQAPSPLHMPHEPHDDD